MVRCIQECAAQMRKLGNEITRTEKIAGADSGAVRAAKALLGTDTGEVK